MDSAGIVFLFLDADFGVGAEGACSGATRVVVAAGAGASTAGVKLSRRFRFVSLRFAFLDLASTTRRNEEHP